MQSSVLEQRFIFRPRSKNPQPVPPQFANIVTGQDNAVTFGPIEAERLLGLAYDARAMSKIMHVTPMVTIDPHEVTRCFDVLSKGVPFACLKRLNAELTKRGMQFSRPDGALIPITQMRTYADTVLKKIQNDALRAICAIGVVPIAFRRDKLNGSVIPYVPAPKTYTIAVGSIRGQRYYRLHWISVDTHAAMLQRQRRPGKGDGPDDRLVANQSINQTIVGSADTSVIVLADFDFEPDVDGKLNSPVAALLESVNNKSDFNKAAKIAEKINANPPLLRQYDAKDDAVDQAALRNTEYVGHGVVDPISEGHNAKVNRQYLRDARQVAVYNQQEHEIAENLGAITGTLVEPEAPVIQIAKHRYDSEKATDAHGNAMPWANDAALPPSWKPATYQLPKPRSDLVSLLEYLDDQVFLTFLIPRQVLEASARLVADADVAAKSLEVVATMWSQYIASVLTYAYDSTYLYDDIKETYLQTVRRKQKDEQPDRSDELRLRVSPKDLGEILNKVATVTISYGVMPTADPKELDRMYAREEIDWQVYMSAKAKQNGIDEELVSERDKFPLEVRRIVGCPEYLSYLQLLESRKNEENRAKEARLSLRIQRETAKRKNEDSAAKGSDDDDNEIALGNDKPPKRPKTKK